MPRKPIIGKERYEDIYHLYDIGITQASIAIRFGVSLKLIGDILHGDNLSDASRPHTPWVMHDRSSAWCTRCGERMLAKPYTSYPGFEMQVRRWTRGHVRCGEVGR